MITEPSPALTVAEFEPEADALIDLLEVTCELRYGQGEPALDPDDGLERLLAEGLLDRGRDILFAWRCPRSGADLELGGRLAFPASGAGRLSTSGRVLRLNSLFYLRRQVDHHCPPGLDGNDNVAARRRPTVHTCSAFSWRPSRGS